MKHSMTMVIIAATLMLTCAFLGIMFNMYGSSKDVSNNQQKKLAEINNEYSNEDVITLNGQVVTPAEALSLVRKYSSMMSIQMNGSAVQNPNSLTKASFGNSSTRWIVRPIESENGAVSILNFEASGRNTGAVPATADEALKEVAARLGLNAQTSSWTSIFNELDDAQESTDYRTKIANLIGSNGDSSWNDVYTDLVAYMSQAGDNTSTVPTEILTVPANSSVNYTILDPVKGVCEATGGKQGSMIFSGNACSVKGDIAMQVDVENSKITNNTGYSVTVTLYSE